MKRTCRRNIFFIAIVASIVLVVSISNWRGVSSARVNAHKDVRAPSALQSTPTLQQLANFPLAFEANRGQTNQRIKFLAREAGGELQLGENSVNLQFQSSALSFRFDGANGTARVIGDEQLVERRNFLLGNDRSRWH